MVGGEKVHDEAHKDAEGVEEEDQVGGDQDGGEDDFARAQVKAAELRSSMQTGVSLMYSNVTFTRVFLSDKDIMKGFKVGHFVDQLLKSIIGKFPMYPFLTWQPVGTSICKAPVSHAHTSVLQTRLSSNASSLNRQEATMKMSRRTWTWWRARSARVRAC